MVVSSKYSQQSHALAAAAPIIGILLLFSVLVLPPIIGGVYGTSESVDMIRAHLVQINTFLQQPSQIFSYPAASATTPGHHILLAGLARALGYSSVAADNLPVRFANAAFGYLVLFVVWRFLSKRETALNAAALTLPLACSSYLVFASIWINTDNGALLFYVISVCGLFGSRTLPASTIATASLMVLWRQVYLPVVGTFAAFWFLNGHRLKLILTPALAIAAPCLIVGAYYLAWGGLTPPNFQEFNGVGHQAAVPLSALAFIGILSPFYLPYIRLSIFEFIRNRPAYVGIVIAIVIVLWLLGSTNYDSSNGRWGALVWSLAKLIPIGGHNSLVVLTFAALGAIVLVSLGYDAFLRGQFPYEIIALCFYLVGYSAQVEAFQRYIQDPILFTLSVSSTRRHSDCSKICIGPLILAISLAFLTTFRVYNLLPTIFN